MTIKDKLLNEFGAAVIAVLGDDAEKDEEECEITAQDLQAIARKTAFYLDLE